MKDNVLVLLAPLTAMADELFACRLWEEGRVAQGNGYHTVGRIIQFPYTFINSSQKRYWEFYCQYFTDQKQAQRGNTHELCVVG